MLLKSCTLLRIIITCVTLTVSSNSDYPRHIKDSPYRCFLPDLTEFKDLYCVGPNYQHHLKGADQTNQTLSREFNLAIADCKLQGTATSPSSTILAERKGFEPLGRFPAHTLSRRTPSAGLGHLSIVYLIDALTLYIMIAAMSIRIRILYQILFF